MREIVLDTETTGLDPTKGDRLVEIGAVEIVNQGMTGAHFHVLVNPERDPGGCIPDSWPLDGFAAGQAAVLWYRR
jgi:DNA polymerase III epsilon subunit-like protein